MTDPPSTPPTTKIGAIIADIRKAIAAATGLVAEGLAVGLLNTTDAKWATIVIGAITTVLVYLVPNGKTSVRVTNVTNVANVAAPAQPPLAGGSGLAPPPHG
jgi:hypothetical protein